ncbi:hypothetical protein AMS68_003678 [Peltaster fructicola]|uniref:SWI5-dependent HO expression protein 3 n=1 Tax=Peltaster fructicola TaxID=286661 RepID=A0A6H0XU12_9PEZI|nr:hypothetical protein AMS68_003678 [Peltaster fructicola]
MQSISNTPERSLARYGCKRCFANNIAGFSKTDNAAARRVASQGLGRKADTPRASVDSHTLSQHSENDSPWSSAVGHATTSGKSGRVIERLMAENDRLKRDLELQLLRSQELERNLQTMRPQLDALRAENSNLSHLKSVDGSLLSRRDRKIETLKEELILERSRREASEAQARHIIAERDDALEVARRDTQQAQDEAKHSSTHASILEQSHRQLSTDYRTRAERWRKDVTQIEADRKAEGNKLARLEVVADQMRTELERSRKLQHDFNEQFEQYREATHRWRGELEEVVTKETSRSKALSDDMQSVVDKMRWVMSNHTTQVRESR